MARRRALPEQPTADDLLAHGIAADEIVCRHCGGPWDGSTPRSLPLCGRHRRINSLALAALVSAVLAPDQSTADRQPAA